MQELSVLIVEDDIEDFDLLEETIAEIKTYTFNITWVSNYKKAFELISQKYFDIYIVDYLLGAYSGLDVCRAIRKAQNHAPIILLTGKGDQEVDNQASELGVNDYLVKSLITASDLERSIRYALKQSQILSALMLSEIKYRSVLQQSQDILFIADTSFQIISISDSLTKITGFNKDDFGSQGLLEIFGNQEFITFLKENINNKRNVSNKSTSIVCKNGNKLSVIVSCNYQEDASQGDFIHGVIIDKTEELRSQQMKLVYEKLESTARLMRTLAHEVRNPLSNISLALEGMEAEEVDSPYLPIISRNADRIENIIKKVLNFAHIENNGSTRENFIAVLENSLENIKDKAQLTGIEIVRNFPTEYFFLLNVEQLSMALNNILLNAVEALAETENGKIEINLKENKLYISDNGPGIAKADQNVIFEPYFTKKKNGIGLGLASCLAVFKAHQLEIELDSDLGRGATFIFTLPPKN